MPILFSEGRPMTLIGSESRDRLAADPSPRLRLGIFNGQQPARESLGRQWSRLPLYPASCKQSTGPFPVSSTARTIGEQKAKVKPSVLRVVGQFEMRPN